MNETSEKPDNKVEGIVSAIIEGKDYGFVTESKPKKEPIDYFLHAQGMVGEDEEERRDRYYELKTGDRVRFVPLISAKGPRAVGVEKED